MKKLSYFIATALIGSSISAAHAEPKMSGTIYIMTEVEHNNKTGVTSTTISDKSSSLYLSDEVRLNNDLWLKWQLGSFIYFDSDRWGGWGTADSYVALNSYKNLGTVKMGYISTPMNSIYLNPFDTNSPILEFGKISRFGQRRVSMAYESPWKTASNSNSTFPPVPMPRAITTTGIRTKNVTVTGSSAGVWTTTTPTTALTRTTLPNTHPTTLRPKPKTSKPTHSWPDTAKTKSPSMPRSNTPKILATALAAGGHGRRRRMV